MYWVVGLLALSFLIVVHEWGHYVVARWCQMRVDRFSVGFGPGILKRKSKKTGTVFQIAPIPLGGFVEISGMNVIEDVDPNDKHSYANRPVWQRFAAILAGPATNFLSAFILAFLLYSVWGVRSAERWFGVGAVLDGYDAKGKLEVGDRILAIDDKPVFLVDPAGNVGTLRERVNEKAGAPLKITVRRDGKELSFSVAPKAGADKAGKPLLDDNNKPIYLLGIAPSEQYERVSIGIGDSVSSALSYPFRQSELIYTGIKRIIVGKDKADVGSGVRMAEEFKKAFSIGFGEGLELVMALSVYLALFNLLPLPALDGGRLVFLGYEMITRRRANPRIEATVHMVGIMLLIVVMILVTFKDCRRLFS
jgi:regulator of sigma E protease